MFPGNIILTSVELEESAAMAPMARAEREATMKEARILMVSGVIWVVEKVLLGEKMLWRCVEVEGESESHGEQSERRRDIN